MLSYKCSTSCAAEYAGQGRLEEWVHAYLLSDGHNKDFSDGLRLFPRYYIGPEMMPVSLFERCCGPEESMKYRVNGEWFEKHVTELADIIKSGADMPPLIVHFTDEGFEVSDGNHRLEAYKRLDVKEIPVIIWITERDELDKFEKLYN